MHFSTLWCGHENKHFVCNYDKHFKGYRLFAGSTFIFMSPPQSGEGHIVLPYYINYVRPCIHLYPSHFIVLFMSDSNYYFALGKIFILK